MIYKIFKLKRLLHHLINVAFYMIFFIIGFLLGGGNVAKINNLFTNIFNNFISFFN